MDTAPTEIYTLSLHDALPIYIAMIVPNTKFIDSPVTNWTYGDPRVDRKSTRLNSSHTVISYAVFCLKKKSQGQGRDRPRLGRRTGLLAHLPAQARNTQV